MMKRFKSIMCALLALLMVMACVSCKTKKQKGSKYDTENDAIRFAIEGQDGVFNPFFSTTAYDSEIAGMTQISMLSVSGKEAQISCGQNEPCVTEDYTEVMLDAEKNPLPAGSSEKPTYTRYSFLIKNGVRFSDGTPLTIADVLFNLYVYLDPVYTGNATIYSTDIVGLAAYRTQDPNIVDSDDESDFNSGFYVTAEARRTAIDQWCQYYLHEINPSVPQGVKPPDDSQIRSDIEILKELFKAELYTDYQSASGSIEDMAKEYTIENQWQVFLYNEGVVSRKTDPANNNRFVKDDNGRYVVDFSAYTTMINNYADANWQNYLGTNAAATEAEKREEAIKDYVINTIVWNKYIETDKDLNYAGIQQVLYSTNASSTIYTRFVAEAKSDYFKNHKGENGKLNVPTVSGITTETGVRNFNGKAYNEDYTVLHILINDVDPKAIWNFAFTVAPRHYYSSAEAIRDYPETGVEFGSTDFMNNVIKNPDKLGVPVGAGAYRASKMGGLSSDTEYPTRERFCENNVIYYERNNYFTTLGTGINNAKIKYFRYQVTNSAQTISSLQTGAVDVASPSATAHNIAEIQKVKGLQSVEVMTNGYGYVGINPKYVPDVYVRQAIMHAMDTSLVLNYYPEGSVERIFWPMSKTSWAFPAQGLYPYYQLWNADEILGFLTSKGYEQRTVDGNKVLGKTENGSFKQLTYTFTIPGSSNDHPANIMFETAATLLNSIGFKISVKVDNWALKKLSTGDLEVWAAAWSSSIDPDMYQVYHKESTASSPLNWGYDVIKMDTTKYSYELNLIDQLSELIDRGRQTTVQNERKGIYAQALIKVMELAVEMPTYQRTDMTVFNADKIDRDSLTPDGELGPNNGLFARLWEMDYVK